MTKMRRRRNRKRPRSQKENSKRTAKGKPTRSFSRKKTWS